MADEKEQNGPKEPTEQKETDKNYGPAKEEGVFKKTIKTVTFQNGYHNDGKDPGFKALAAASMASLTAISGVKTGTGQIVIRGDSSFHYMENHSVIIEKIDTLVVNQDQNELVKGDTQHFYKQDFLRAVSGNDDVRVNKQRNIIVLGESQENYVGKHEVTAPEEFEWKSYERGFSFLKLDMATLAMDVHLTAGDVHVVDAEATVFETKGGTFHEILEAQRGRAIALILAAAIELDVMFRGDVLVDLGTGTPFR
jgi:hypothetical protein